VHGPSLVTTPGHDWTTDWRGRPWEEAVICELHIGTFTPEGTFRAAIDRLDALADTGFTAIEIMPVAQFAGDRGWGYDGVLPYAPHPAYGTPDDLRALVDAAHARGLMVLLDVVWNHFGPEGNYLHAYAAAFFDPERHTPWGAGIDYTQPAVRRFFIDNALYWLARLPAGRAAARRHRPDPRPDAARASGRTGTGGARPHHRPPVHLTTEDNRNVTHLHVEAGGCRATLYTAEWNDDMHNAAHVLATGEADAYYRPFADDPAAHLARALAEGFAFQGPERGAPSAHLPPTAFVDFLQNHDQTGNRALGERLVTLTDPAMHDALTAILLLSPHIPLMFMGEDWGETRPFLFFADFTGDLGRAVTEGRRREFADFPAFAGHTGDIPDPVDPATWQASRLDWARRDSLDGREAREKVRRLLTLRRERIVPHLAATGGHCGTVRAGGDGVVAVDWRLGPVRLELRANLGDTAADLPEAAGELLHLAGDAPGALRSPTSVDRASDGVSHRHLPPPVPERHGLRPAAALVPLPRCAGCEPSLRIAPLHGDAGLDPRLRHHRPNRDRSGPRRARGARAAVGRADGAGHGPRPRHRAEPHGLRAGNALAPRCPPARGRKPLRPPLRPRHRGRKRCGCPGSRIISRP
jgi:maltooligosyltrehalose trehalohydrolase